MSIFLEADLSSGGWPILCWNNTISSVLIKTYNSYEKVNKINSQQIYHVDYTSSHSSTEVKQHWALIILGWETLLGISGSAGTYPLPPPPGPGPRPPPPCRQSTVFSDSLCLNQVIETRSNKQKINILKKRK